MPLPGSVAASHGQPPAGFHLAYSPGFRDGTLGAPPSFPRASQARG
jgi:hypothetical protein